MPDTPLGITYPGTGDSPHGPNQIKVVAEDADDLLVPASVYRNIFQVSIPLHNEAASGFYIPGLPGAKSATSNLNGSMMQAIGLKAADYAVAGKTTKYRLRAQLFTNGTAPGTLVYVNLRPITSSGGAGILNWTTGSALIGGEIQIEGAANAESDHVGADFVPESDGPHTITVESDAKLAANASLIVTAQLQIRWV